MKVKHNLAPIYNKDSCILILGSFPSVKSREGQFYYHHPQNRFWKILAALYNVSFSSIEAKQNFLATEGIALWDVIATCEMKGSSDASITQVNCNDIAHLLKCCPIHSIYTNGKKAHQLYQKHIFPLTQKAAIPLPSTSPANAAFSLEELIKAWSIIQKKP